MKNILIWFSVVFLLLWGIFMTLGAIVSTSRGTSKDVWYVDVILWLFLGLLPIGAGIGLALYQLKKSQKQKQQHLETLVVHLALQMPDQILTPALLAMHLHTELKIAETILSTLQKDGFAELLVSEDGVIAYKFNLKFNTKGHERII